jgi:hypothetical protein
MIKISQIQHIETTRVQIKTKKLTEYLDYAVKSLNKRNFHNSIKNGEIVGCVACNTGLVYFNTITYRFSKKSIVYFRCEVQEFHYLVESLTMSFDESIPLL